jgi:hypothetical protein
VPSRATHEYGVEKHQDKSKCKQQPKIGTCGHAAAHSTGAHRDDHVPSAKACQVPRRAKCQGARPTDTQGRAGQARRAREQRAHTTRGRDAQGDFTGARSRRSRAKCQGVPSARACQVPGRAKCQGARPISHHDEAQHAGTSGGPTRTPQTHEDSQQPGHTCQVPRRAKCQGVPSAKASCRKVQRPPRARVMAAWERGGYGLRTRADARGSERAVLYGRPAPRPPGDRRCHGWCWETLNGKVFRLWNQKA